MHSTYSENLLVIGGIIALVAAGWVVHPALGLCVAGLLAIALGIGLYRGRGQ